MNKERCSTVNKLLMLTVWLLLVVAVKSIADDVYADIVVVDYNDCSRGLLPNQFYKSITVNQDTRGQVSKYDMTAECRTECSSYYNGSKKYRCNIGNGLSAGFPGNREYSNAALFERTFGDSCSQNLGRWVAMYLPEDIRNVKKDNYVISVTAQNGIGQIYIPLLLDFDGGLEYRKAYMIRIPNSNKIWNDGRDFSWKLGNVKNWSAGWANGAALYKTVDINVACILQKIHRDTSPGNLKSLITLSGNIKDCLTPVKKEHRNPVQWADKNILDLVPVLNTFTTDGICETPVKMQPADDFTKIIRYIKNVYSDLGGLFH